MGEIVDCIQNKEGIYKPSTNVSTIHTALCSLKRELEVNFLKMGALLSLINKQKLYLDMDYTSFDEYCSIPEIDLSRSQVFKLIAVYERWIIKYKHKPEELEGISVEKLYIASSQAKDDNESEWLEKARTLSRADLKAETSGSVQHSGLKTTETRMIMCPHCGKSFYLQE